MRILNNLKNLRKNKKGFTLIEIVIVIVIIAILAAMLVPSMLSWIDKANQRTFLSACDSIETAVLTSASEQYAINSTFTPDWDQVSKLVGTTCAATGTASKDLYVIAIDQNNIKQNKITGTTITDGKYIGTAQADGSWDVVKVGDKTTTPAG